MILLTVTFLVLGLIMGSFLNASTWRLYKQSKLKTKPKGKNRHEYSILYGRSMCPNCKHQLGALDLIPVFSWLALKGNCRYCHKIIGWQEPSVEVGSGLAFALSYVFWPSNFTDQQKILFLFWLVILCGFIALALYDLRWKLLPNRLVMILVSVVFLQLLMRIIFFKVGLDVVLSAIWGVIFIAGLFYGLFVLSDGRWIGGGDVKLGVALGLLVGGPAEAILVVFGASLIGTAIALPLMLLKKLKRTTTIAFGPLLIASTTLCYLFGPSIVSWYKNLVIIGH